MAKHNIVVFATTFKTNLLEKAFDIDLNVKGSIPKEVEEEILRHLKKTHHDYNLSEADVLWKARLLKELLDPFGGVEMLYSDEKANYKPLKQAYPTLTWL
ncbi:hypothetical protein AB6F65_18710 [Providencia hangzhouensis]|uniref:hypothetical protein n=1 Tax=Providencia hangzhouensis TaxID=3031799 RepID=UPI0034DD652B